MAAAERDDRVPPTSCDGRAGGPRARPRPDAVLGSRLAPAVSFATTEHFTLQTARGITVAEANGRASIYLAALSANLVALALVGQVSRLGPAFHALALILLPVLGFVGVVTFNRLVQCSIEDIAYAMRIGRLRDFYLSVVPELEPHVLVVRGQHAAALLHGQRACPSGWQLALTTAGMVAVVNSVLIGACAGVLLETAGVTSLAVTLVTGAVLAAAAQILQSRHHQRTLSAFTLEAVDRAAIFVPVGQQANTT
jgi:hypothetical protein